MFNCLQQELKGKLISKLLCKCFLSLLHAEWYRRLATVITMIIIHQIALAAAEMLILRGQGSGLFKGRQNVS